ncbi:hypothetical protein QT196_39020 (plasmid) [Streptomyces sp. P9-2B-2]|uniref:hypothetical protein n=1 Tax=Streptomyces sp. P9-2B-2 TaxID=3057114 RepID=UPI0025B2B60E|nr:hypothetical protein [Streptomyces sp. P9-2B-2]WJY43253.1 hypothetical protein QT196_39020 [Streptomyces sp. P9-2B-2]
MREEPVVASVAYTAVCENCGAQLECWGTQALVAGVLRWDVESACAACGQATATCGHDVPHQLRDRLLADLGPTTLHLADTPARVVLMRVLRAQLGTDLANIAALTHRVLDGTYTGTLPEVEHLARTLRMAGIAAVAGGR